MRLDVKRVGDNYYITRGTGRLRTSIKPHDINDPNEHNKVYPINLNGTVATITTSNGKQISTGFRSDYIRRYFDI